MISPSRFDGAVVLVTGGAGALGFAAAEKLSQQGARVVIVDVDETKALQAAEALPGEAVGIAADVTDEQQVESSIAQAVSHFGRIDGLHLNAGLFGPPDGVTTLDAAAFETVMRVNVTGVFLGIKHGMRQLEKQGTGGSIVTVSSIAGIRGSDDLFAYHTSKHAVVGMMHSAAMYGGPLGIRVNAIAPGTVPTALFASAGGTQDAIDRSATTPMRRAGRPGEIADLVAFLLSSESTYINGETISIDGGAKSVNIYRPNQGAGLWTPAR